MVEYRRPNSDGVASGYVPFTRGVTVTVASAVTVG